MYYRDYLPLQISTRQNQTEQLPHSEQVVVPLCIIHTWKACRNVKEPLSECSIRQHGHVYRKMFSHFQSR